MKQKWNKRWSNKTTTVTVSVPLKNPTWLHMGNSALSKWKWRRYYATKNQVCVCLCLISSNCSSSCNFKSGSASQLQSCKSLWIKEASLGLSTGGSADIRREAGYHISPETASVPGWAPATHTLMRHLLCAISSPQSLASITVVRWGRRRTKSFISILAVWGCDAEERA